MKLIDFVLLAIVAVLIGVAVHFIRKGRSCCGGGKGCSGNCGSCNCTSCRK